jgi:hypothetical protein
MVKKNSIIFFFFFGKREVRTHNHWVSNLIKLNCKPGTNIESFVFVIYIYKQLQYNPANLDPSHSGSD